MSNHQIQTLIRSGHNMIFSNVDALYMDCGFSAWIGEGLNWCAPYKSNDLSLTIRFLCLLFQQ